MRIKYWEEHREGQQEQGNLKKTHPQFTSCGNLTLQEKNNENQYLIMDAVHNLTNK